MLFGPVPSDRLSAHSGRGSRVPRSAGKPAAARCDQTAKCAARAQFGARMPRAHLLRNRRAGSGDPVSWLDGRLSALASRHEDSMRFNRRNTRGEAFIVATSLDLSLRSSS